MNEEIIFSEKQKAKEWWLWLIFLFNGGIWLHVFYKYKQVITFFYQTMSCTGILILIATAVSSILALLFVSFLRLETIIKKDGIYVRFFPFHLKFKHYTWQTLTKSFVRQYSPLREYGGWGLRLAGFRKGWAYNVSGNKGLQLEFTDKKKLLIGTNKADELSEALISIGQLKK